MQRMGLGIFLWWNQMLHARIAALVFLKHLFDSFGIRRRYPSRAVPEESGSVAGIPRSRENRNHRCDAGAQSDLWTGPGIRRRRARNH